MAENMIRRAKDTLKNLLLFSIGTYRKFVSPYMIRTCRYHPSCSEYAQEAISHYGALTGTVKAIKRVLRCHPFSAGGYDPVDKG